MNAANLDAVTIDAYGTLLTLLDPVPELQRLLPDHDERAIAQAFRTEASFYRSCASDGHDARSLARLREDCVAVFNETLGSQLSADAYVGTLRFAVLPGVVPALERLERLGLVLAVVGNWDISLHEQLVDAGLARFFATVVHAADKPAPDGILDALDRLGINAARALHIGDDEADEEAARAAGIHFAQAPLEEAIASIV